MPISIGMTTVDLEDVQEAQAYKSMRHAEAEAWARVQAGRGQRGDVALLVAYCRAAAEARDTKAAYTPNVLKRYEDARKNKR